MRHDDKTRRGWRVAALCCGLALPVVLVAAAAAQTITPIATIQGNPGAYDGQVVTVEGQVYIPANYRGGTVYSGYIQDGSGRGINLFGNNANNPALFTLGNIVRVTGTVDIFFTTVEITSLSNVILVSSGNPPLQPQQLSTAAAASTSWEGTFIEVTGTISAATPSGPGTNYTVSDGSGPIDVRVVDNLGVAAFSIGQEITARGAGGQFGTTFQVLVGRAIDVFVGSGGDTTPPTLTGAATSTATQVTVSYSERVAAATAEVTSNYAVFETATPANFVQVSGATLATDARSVTLALGSSLQAGVGYTVRVNNVEDEAGNAILPNSTQTFTYSSVQVTPIATIQANPSAFEGLVVTVEGQVFVPANYRAPTYSGYIQDGSGRGINLFGSAANNTLLNDLGNIVRVTGTVDLFFTTVEILDLTEVTLVSSGNPPLAPQQLGTGAAASASWEGTFIEVTGTISAVTPSGPGTNYTVSDGSGPIDVRVVDNLGVAPFSVGQEITARGAGGQFGTTFQVLVGRAVDVFVAGGGDTTPPTLTAATASTATQVTVSFSEAVTVATAEVEANYAVFETLTPGNTVAVTNAALSGQAVTLTLGASLQNGVGYTVRVNNVQDVAGNTIAANSTRTFTFSSVQVTPIATIQANPSAFDGQVVTVEGQVYVPANYRAPTFSGYIQDSSNRGINLFGSSANNALLNDVGNIVRVTGTVDLFFTTVEITSLTNVTLVSSGNPELQPQQLSVGAAASSVWEGTFIEVTGAITAATPSGPGTNYTVNDGSGTLDVRVVDNLGAGPFTVGQTITARGAGSQFSSTFQILVGRAADVFVTTSPSGPAGLSLGGPPFTFVPTLGETYPIAVSVPPEKLGTSEVLLRVFDLQGRLRRTLVDSRFGPVLPKVPWDGRDDASELVPSGTYVVHLLLTDKTSGGRESLQMPVVVATRLDR